MSRPRIAVPMLRSARIRGLRFSGSVVADAVLESVVRAGGEPVPVPPAAAGPWRELDGLVLPGGPDVDPARYGAEPDGRGSGSDFPEQDDADARALFAAERLGLPGLLICRGMQLWNVERGGTLFPHLPEEPRQHLGATHPVSVTPGSLLHEALGGAGQAEVSSYHHQGVDRLGEGLRVVAAAPDGTVEAVEDPALRIVAVQWHPEDLAERGGSDARLFEWLVAEAARRAAEAA
ncbi:MAG: gamma-glutamyl-gamma-aminobutyrate hydrolase family protein [Pseudoclavibacter sp.]|nr:gamma-glutamyl-gamma-aminobutyrate hydrolase family protein [Pseudoclavibacter sp.]